jgi:hypothetical protein
MKKILSMLCVVLVVGFGGTAIAEPPDKVEVCHNGSVYTGDTTEGADYDPDAWVPGSFVIRISEKAAAKHAEKHGDKLDNFSRGAEGADVTTFVMENEGIITLTEMQPSCS